MSADVSRLSSSAAAITFAIALAIPAAAPAATCTDMPQKGCLYPFPNVCGGAPCASLPDNG